MDKMGNSVPERAFSGTEYACCAKKGFLGYATHFLRHSVRKTGFCGTKGIFGTRNALLRYGVHHHFRAHNKKKDAEKLHPHNQFTQAIFPQPTIHLTAKRLTRQSNHNYLISIRRVAGAFSCSTRLGSVMSSTPFTISALTASRSMFSGRVKL